MYIGKILFYVNAECKGNAGSSIEPKSMRIICRIFCAIGFVLVVPGVLTIDDIPTTRCSITKAA